MNAPHSGRPAPRPAPGQRQHAEPIRCKCRSVLLPLRQYRTVATHRQHRFGRTLDADHGSAGVRPTGHGVECCGKAVLRLKGHCPA